MFVIKSRGQENAKSRTVKWMSIADKEGKIKEVSKRS